MLQLIEVPIDSIPTSELGKAWAWCKKWGRSWREAKAHRQHMVAAYRANGVEFLESRTLMSITGFSLNGPASDPNAGSNQAPACVVGQSPSVDVSFSTDHDDDDGGQSYYHVDYGDGTSDDGQTSSGDHGIGHAYMAAGNYTMSVSVWDDPGYHTFTGGTWDGSEQGGSVSISVGGPDLTVATNNGTYEFYPNQNYSSGYSYFAEFGAGDYPDAGNYQGDINWGDGSSSAAHFDVDPSNHAVMVMGDHTYNYQLDAAGDVARPVADFGEQTSYTASAHVTDATSGNSIDLQWQMMAHLSTWFNIQAKQPGSGKGSAGITSASVAVGKGTATFYITGYDKLDDKTVTPTPSAAATTGSTAACTVTIAPLAGTYKGTVGGVDPCTYTMTITWDPNRVTTDELLVLRVTDALGAPITFTLSFTTF